MGGPASNGISRAPLYLGSRRRGNGISATRLSLSPARFSNTIRLCHFFVTLWKLSSASSTVLLPQSQQRLLPCTELVWTGPCSLTTTWGISSISFPPGTEMFHFSGLLTYGVTELLPWGCPIQRSAGQCLLAARRGVSPLAASFVARMYQGIRPLPLIP